VKLRCWGTRGNLATPRVEMLGLGGNSSCYEVILDSEHSLMLDAGTGLIEFAEAIMPEALARPMTFHIAISHFHWDHVLGFPFFHPIHVPHTQVHLYSAFPAWLLEQHVRALFDGTYSPLRSLENLPARIHFHQIEAAGIEVLGSRLTRCQLDHSEESYGFRIEYQQSTVCYVSDHEARSSPINDRVITFARGADLLLHDAQFTAAEYASRGGWGHSSIEAALRNAGAAEVHRAVLIHHDPAHEDDFLRSYVVGLHSDVPFELGCENVVIAV
jgi:ribonuclease BN (tRNA processing enzyme)